MLGNYLEKMTGGSTAAPAVGGASRPMANLMSIPGARMLGNYVNKMTGGSKADKAAPAAGGGPQTKPELRGMTLTQTKNRFVQAVVFTVAITVAFRVLYVDARRKKYASFHRTYNADKDFNRMVRAGVFHSVQPDGTVGNL